MTEVIEKVLLSQDDELLSYIVGDLKQFQQPFNKLVAAYDDLNLGDMTPEVFEEIKRGQAIKSVRLYEKELEESLDKTKVFNPTLRANLLQGTGDISSQFLTAAKSLLTFEAKKKEYNRDEQNVLKLEFVSLKDGELVVSDEAREQILEKYCRYYLETDEQHRLYGIMSTIAEQYRAFHLINKELGLELITTHSMNSLDRFFLRIGSDVKPNPDAILGACKFRFRKGRNK